MPERIRITDVSPRDGLQNEPGTIPAADKVRLITLLSETGVDEIEATSFVSPKWIPQLGDARQVLEGLAAWTADQSSSRLPIYSVLVPNEQGMLEVERARREIMAIDKIAVFTAASEAFSRKNTNASIAESIKRFEPVVELAKTMGDGTMAIRGYISCAIACPFEGPIKPDKVAQVAQALSDLGCTEIDLGDTIGAAEAETTNFLIQALTARLGDDVLKRTTLHLHDTFGRAAECVREALQLGIRSFDGSVAGIGGCPYASTPGKRAPGNISTEVLVRTVEDAGFQTGVNRDKLSHAAAFASSIVAKSRGAA